MVVTVRALVAMLAALLALAAAPADARRIVAIGDLHGDAIAWRAIAGAAGLVDPQGRWTGGDTILVQTGDVVDRGPASLPIIRDLMRLQGEAPRAGGQVIALVGNHEAMNVTDDLRYVAPGDYAAFVTRRSAQVRDAAFEANRDALVAAYRARDPTMSLAAIRRAWIAATPLGLVEHQHAWHPGGEIGRWVVANPAAVLIDGTLLVHGGISPAYARLPLAEINRRVAAAMIANDQRDTSIINAADGPLWDRAYADPGSEAALATVLAAYGAQRMVIAHTPHPAGIIISPDRRLAQIDTAISSAYGGTLSWLEIADGVMTAHIIPRPPTGATG